MRDYIDSIFHDKEVTYDGELHTIEIDLPEELFEIINASDFYFSQANEDGEFIELEICYLLENWYFYPTAGGRSHFSRRWVAYSSFSH